MTPGLDLGPSAELTLRNLLAWSLQTGIVVGLLAVLSRVVHVESPGLRLRALQLILLLLLLLPALQPWPTGTAGVDWTLGLTTTQPGSGVTPPMPGANDSRLHLVLLVFAALLAAVVAQLGRLAVGLGRLRTLRRSAVEIDEPGWLADLRSQVALRARFVTAASVRSPATFGIVRPLIVLPPRFASLPVERQRALALHELVHVRRRDWVALVAEELVKAVLGFHPGMRWLVGRIRLAREQCVDAEVVRRLGARHDYLESLIQVGRSAMRGEPVPAAPFLREQHLRERVDLLLKEVPMSRVRTLAHVGVTVTILALATTAVTLAFPLIGPPETLAEPPTLVASQRHEAPTAEKGPLPAKINNVAPRYPTDAKEEGVQGLFLVSIRIDQTGRVADARVIASAPNGELLEGIAEEKRGTSEALLGDERLGRAAVDAVSQWRYEPPVDQDGAPREIEAVVTVNFQLR